MAPQQQTGDHEKTDDKRQQDAFTNAPCQGRDVGSDRRREIDAAHGKQLDLPGPFKRTRAARQLMAAIGAHPKCLPRACLANRVSGPVNRSCARKNERDRIAEPKSGSADRAVRYCYAAQMEGALQLAVSNRLARYTCWSQSANQEQRLSGRRRRSGPLLRRGKRMINSQPAPREPGNARKR